MELRYFLTVGLLFLLLFLLWFWNYKKEVTGFPAYSALLLLVRAKITGKLSKYTSLNNAAFEELIEIGKRHIQEGHFMMFTDHPVLFIYSSEAIKFFGNEKAASDKALEYHIFEEVIGAGIAISNGERWKTHRKLINPAFHMGVLKEKVPLFNKYAMLLIKDMENLVGKQSVQILDILKFPYFYALNESVLGLKQDTVNKERLLELARSVDNISSMPVKKLIYPWLQWKFMMNLFPSGRKYLQENKKWSDFIMDTITNMKKWTFSTQNEDHGQFSNHLRKSFAYILLNHHLNNPNTFTLKDLYDEVRNIIAGGYESVSHATLYCLYLLGTHPEIQEKVFHEIQSVTSEYISYEESCDLKYLEAVIMETLRLYPVLPAMGRNLSEDVQYGKHRIRKGTTIVYFIYLSHRDPKIYPDPEKFDPERFFNDDSKKTCNFMPFGQGSRSCIGQNYALLEMKIFLGHLLRNFQIMCLDNQEDVKLTWSIGLFPLKQLNFKIASRKIAHLHNS